MEVLCEPLGKPGHRHACTKALKGRTFKGQMDKRAIDLGDSLHDFSVAMLEEFVTR